MVEAKTTKKGGSITETRKIYEKRTKDVKLALEKICDSGVKLFIDGAESSVEDVISSCVNEDYAYMPDYVVDTKGCLTEIRYDRISFV